MEQRGGDGIINDRANVTTLKGDAPLYCQINYEWCYPSCMKDLICNRASSIKLLFYNVQHRVCVQLSTIEQSYSCSRIQHDVSYVRASSWKSTLMHVTLTYRTEISDRSRSFCLWRRASCSAQVGVQPSSCSTQKTSKPLGFFTTLVGLWRSNGAPSVRS